MLVFKQLELGPMANYIYVVGDSQSRECAIVDPGWEAPVIWEAVTEERLQLRAIILTHNHFDHIGALGEILKLAQAPVYINRADAADIEAAAGKNLKAVSDGETISIGSVKVSLLHTPGHTAGSQCVKIGDNLLTGDTLFINGCGRVDLPTSDASEMYQSLRKLSDLPEQTVIWPGHNYAQEPSASLQSQLQTNPYLKTSSQQTLPDFLRLVGA